jgi:hypothetical protein
MLRPLLPALALLIAIPGPAFAKRICLDDGLRVYTLDVQGTCKAQKAGSRKIKTAAVRGFTQAGVCPSSAVTGTCIGTENGIVLQLIGQPEPNNGCTKFLVYANGSSLTSLSGAYDNAPFGADDGAIAFTQVGCP